MSPSNERSAEMFSRVRMMASGNDKRDLSVNDIRALKHVLAAAEAREDGSVVDRINAAVQSVQPTPNQPTAAEVIAAAEKALNTSECYLRIYENENKHRDSWDESEDQEILRTDQKELQEALALIARWKEANGGNRV